MIPSLQRSWRPFLGWVCVFAFAWDTVLRPLVAFIWVLAGNVAPVLSNLTTEQLTVLLTILLGLGGLRTVEKLKGRT